jgi:hypothetical protein
MRLAAVEKVWGQNLSAGVLISRKSTLYKMKSCSHTERWIRQASFCHVVISCNARPWTAATQPTVKLPFSSHSSKTKLSGKGTCKIVPVLKDYFTKAWWKVEFKQHTLLTVQGALVDRHQPCTISYTGRATSADLGLLAGNMEISTRDAEWEVFA